jgi:hypothetical protein
VPAGQSVAGFLSNYANLKPNPRFEDTVSYVSADPAKNVHRYVAVIIDAPVVYVAGDVADDAIPASGVTALKEYFHNAMKNAVEDAFPLAQSSGPLVLRLRSAIVGMDLGPQQQSDGKDADVLNRRLNIRKVGVEMELVDSETGDQIAAVVDTQNLRQNVAGVVNFSRDETFSAAVDAFNGWASRLRQFLDSAQELSAEDVQRVEETDFPYASGPPATETAQR